MLNEKKHIQTKTVRAVLSTATIVAGTIAVGAAPQGTAEAYCDVFGVPRTYTWTGAIEAANSNTCDGLGDYYGYFEDTVRDGKSISLEYTHYFNGFGFGGQTKQGVSRIYYGWKYQPPGWGRIHLCQSSPFHCSQWISNKNF